ncbi:hypothetical protein FB550_12131 [Neobacillus bataviensis]|uniref:Uncharacterized protein n=1 Tax=Neobacillus bataviensis TaxID=220685 RepID=A0A561CK70_9BACI|nr:hypothetical protein [Neobacillus bataviensis]TWD91589.1 hypothetical protein FB550_12131 [Neobacillus bataviensis]
MDFYEKLPNDVLITFYKEINKNIKKGILTKQMYYELGLIFSVMSRRGISLNKPCDLEEVVDSQIMKNIIA